MQTVKCPRKTPGICKGPPRSYFPFHRPHFKPSAHTKCKARPQGSLLSLTEQQTAEMRKKIIIMTISHRKTATGSGKQAKSSVPTLQAKQQPTHRLPQCRNKANTHSTMEYVAFSAFSTKKNNLKAKKNKLKANFRETSPILL